MKAKILIPCLLLSGITVGAATCAPTISTQTAAELEVALTAADQAALVYVTLPLCSSTVPAPCSNAAISAKIKVAAQAAYSAVKGAENGSVALSVAQAAFSAYSSLIPATK